MPQLEHMENSTVFLFFPSTHLLLTAFIFPLLVEKLLQLACKTLETALTVKQLNEAVWRAANIIHGLQWELFSIFKIPTFHVVNKQTQKEKKLS